MVLGIKLTRYSFIFISVMVLIYTQMSSFTLDEFYVSWKELNFNSIWVISSLNAMVLVTILYILNRSRSIYLVDFSCYKPEDSCKSTKQQFIDACGRFKTFTQESLEFQKKVLEKSGLGEETYLPEALLRNPPNPSLAEAIKEVETMAFGALDDLFEKTRLNPKEIGILIVNCGSLCPTPSISAMIVNRYKLRSNIMSYNLGGMACSASVISVDLAKNLLQVHKNTYAVVVSVEPGTLISYNGNDRSMLVMNCLLRVGTAAMLLSNKRADKERSKYQLVHTVRTHKGADDEAFGCVTQREDSEGRVGIALSRNLMVVAGDALKTNITALGSLVLPLSEQLLFLAVLVARKVFKIKSVKPYVPDFKLAFEHFLIHPGGKAVLNGVQQNLKLTDLNMEASRMTLNRFGNTSSTSTWYVLAYIESKGRVKKGDRIWQVAFGSGFKCNTAVWKALLTVNPTKELNPWTNEIELFPVDLPNA